LPEVSPAILAHFLNLARGGSVVHRDHHAPLAGEPVAHVRQRAPDHAMA
jgi:hypothetical protein